MRLNCAFYLHFLHSAWALCNFPNKRSLCWSSSLHIFPLLLVGSTLHLLSCRVHSCILLRFLVILLISKTSIAPCTTALLAPTLQLVDHLFQALQLLHCFLQQPELFGQLDGEGWQSELVRAILLLSAGPGAPTLARWSQFYGAGGGGARIRSQRVGSSSIPSLVWVDGEVWCPAEVRQQGGCEQETGTNAKHNCPHFSLHDL